MNSKGVAASADREASWFSPGTDSPELLLSQIRGLVQFWKQRQSEYRDQPRKFAQAKRMELRCRKLLAEMKLEITGEQENGETAPLGQRVRPQ